MIKYEKPIDMLLSSFAKHIHIKSVINYEINDYSIVQKGEGLSI